MSYRYIDEIQRLQRIINENDMDGDRSQGEIDKSEQRDRKETGKKGHSRKHSRTMSEGSDDFEEVRDVPQRNPRIV